ncbi:MAG: DNA ligase, partial [Thermoplasmata archaeon]|nr:DNA ligase [Thermoplasmata archaeon]
MRFAELTTVYNELEATTKRLEMRKILSGLVQRVARSELAEVLYLSQGLLRPEYERVELGVADSLARRALAGVTGTEEEKIRQLTLETGDLGLTAERLFAGRAPPAEVDSRTVAEVYAQLRAIAESAGEG